jgi:hypothetical protein
LKLKKRRYSVNSNLIDEETKAYLLKQMKGHIEFYATPGSSSVNLNRGVKVDVWVTRCYGCGGFMVENYYENSDNVTNPLNGYKCRDCKKDRDKIYTTSRVTESQRNNEMKFEDSLTLQIMPYGKTVFKLGKKLGFFK